MKILLHAGMPKAGSTALQTTLRRAHPNLLRRGVLYPITDEGHQNFALAGVVPYSRLPRGYKRAYLKNQEALEDDFKKYWRKIVGQVNRYRPATLLLSGEAFFRTFSPQEVENLNQLLRPLADSVEVVFYVRSPSEYYLSSVQQGLRASHEIKPIRAISYRATIEPYLKSIGDKVSVIPFVRDELYGRDIALDFASRFIPDCMKDVESSAAGSTNETVSAEAMSILQSYRNQNHSDRADIHTADTSILIDFIRDVERSSGLYSRPKLKPEIIATLDRLSRDMLWLKDTFGISHVGFDEEELDQAERPTPIQPRTVDEICEVDLDKRDRLLMLVVNQILVQDPFYNGRIGRYARSLYKSLLGRQRLPDKRKEGQTPRVRSRGRHEIG